MKLIGSSIRVIITITIIAMGLQGLALALISSGMHRDHAIKNHKKTIEKMVNIRAVQLLQELGNTARDLGLSQQQEPEFKVALKSKDIKSLEIILNSHFHRFFVTTGMLKLEKLIVLDRDFLFLAETSEGDTILEKRDVACTEVLEWARQSEGANRLKIKSGLCENNEKNYHLVITPIGGLSIKGYMLIITDPVNNLLSIEKDLGMSMRFFYGDGTALYKSDDWDKIKSHGDYLLTDYHLSANQNKHSLQNDSQLLVADPDEKHYKSGLHVEVIENITPLYNKLPNTRVLIMTSASVITLIAIVLALIIIHKTTLNPLSKMTKQLSLIRKDKNRLSDKIEVKGTYEIRQLSISFNEMTSQLEELYGRMEEMAYTDQLTNLPNRYMFNEQLHMIIVSLQSSGLSFALLMMDLNKFKPINDTLGHKVGDKVLQEVGRRLKSVLRDHDNVLKIDNESIVGKEESSIARLGGDEFTAIINNISDPDMAKIVAEKIIHIMQKPFKIDGHQLEVGISIGIALCPHDANCDSELLHKADVAMYHAKNNQSHYAFYEESMGAAVKSI